MRKEYDESPIWIEHKEITNHRKGFGSGKTIKHGMIPITGGRTSQKTEGRGSISAAMFTFLM